MQILPDGASDSARDANVVLETGPAATDRFENEILDDRSALGPQRADIVVFAEGEVASGIPYDEPAKPLVWTLTSPCGDTMTSMVFILRRLRPG